MSLNVEIARSLFRIGDILSIKGDRFRSRAYNMAAQRVNALSEDIGVVAERGGLTNIPGVGESIAVTILELLETGESSVLFELIDSLPEGVLEMMEVEGVGPKLAFRFSRELGVTGVDELEDALKEHRVRNLRGLGAKREENILRAIMEYRSRSSRFLLGEVLPIIQGVLSYLGDLDVVRRVEVAGSGRRRRETVGDLDVVVSSYEAEEVMSEFVSMPPVVRVLGQGVTKSTVVLRNMLQVDLRVVSPESFGAALQYFTGSMEHNVRVRTIGMRKGLKLNEYGLFHRESGDLVVAEDEEAIYERLGMEWIPPELRENTGEVEAGLEGRLPELVTLEDVRGDLHVHTSYSHGLDGLEDMVVGAVEMGLEYMAVTDHSRGLAIAGGLSEEKLGKQVEEVRGLDEKYSEIRILTGSEVDIKGDGSLDYGDDILSMLDWVVASVHTGFQNDVEKMTDRVLDAIHNPYVNVIGHPTGRLIQKRKPYAIDLDLVFLAAVEQDVLLEINCNPLRLDLRDVDVRRGLGMGVKFSLGSDAHGVNQLEYLPLGVGVARRGWLGRGDVVNTWGVEEVLGYRL